MRDDEAKERHPARTDVVSVMWGKKAPSNNSSVNGNKKHAGRRWGNLCHHTTEGQDPHRKDPNMRRALDDVHPETGFRNIA